MEVTPTEHKVRDICEVYLKCIHAQFVLVVMLGSVPVILCWQLS